MGLLAKAFKKLTNIFSAKKISPPQNRDPVPPSSAAHAHQIPDGASTTSSVRVSTVSKVITPEADVPPKEALHGTEALQKHSTSDPIPEVADIDQHASVGAIATDTPIESHEPIEQIKSAAVTGEIDDSPSNATPPLGEVIPEAVSADIKVPQPAFAASYAFTSVAEGGDGVFRVLSNDQLRLFEMDLSAGLYNAAISPSGRYAAIQTTIGQGNDSNRLMLVDIENRRVVFSVAPETRWADAYEFTDDTQHLKVILDSVGAFEYDAHGRCLDQHYFDDPELNTTRYSEIIPAAQALLDEPTVSPERANIALKMAIKARSLGADKDAKWNPLALKVQGLAYDQLGQSKEALDCLVKATELKPRIGLKRKIEALSIKVGELS
jgi:hypothetical protein